MASTKIEHHFVISKRQITKGAAYLAVWVREVKPSRDENGTLIISVEDIEGSVQPSAWTTLAKAKSVLAAAVGRQRLNWTETDDLAALSTIWTATYTESVK